MTQTVQRTGTMPLRCSRGTVLSAEEYRNSTVRGFLALAGPLISSLCGLRVQRTSNFRRSTV